MVCTKCSEDKHPDDFFWKDKSKNKKHTQCKECYKSSRKSKEHYNKYKDEYIKRAKIRNKKTRKEIRSKLLEYLSDKKCTCGENRPACLDFHHIDKNQKFTDISTMIRSGYNWNKILEEINKCEILCANCHRIKTANEFNWYKC